MSNTVDSYPGHFCSQLFGRLSGVILHHFGGFVPAILDQLSGVDCNFNDSSPLGPIIIVLLLQKYSLRVVY